MPQFIPTKAHERFYGLAAEGDGTDIHRDETLDSRNTDISTKGELRTRNGLSKGNSTAETGGVIRDGGYISVAGTITKFRIINGELRTVT